MFDKQNDSGVSPVIGVILMVAVTVALVALVTVTVFDLGGDVSESPDATVQLEESDGNVSATLLRNENVEQLYLAQNGNSWGNDSAYGDGGTDSDIGTEPVGQYESPMESAGDVISTSGFSDSTSQDGSTTPPTATGDAGDPATGTPVNVIAVMPDGSEEVLTSTTIE